MLGYDSLHASGDVTCSNGRRDTSHARCVHDQAAVPPDAPAPADGYRHIGVTR